MAIQKGTTATKSSPQTVAAKARRTWDSPVVAAKRSEVAKQATKTRAARSLAAAAVQARRKSFAKRAQRTWVSRTVAAERSKVAKQAAATRAANRQRVAPTK